MLERILVNISQQLFHHILQSYFFNTLTLIYRNIVSYDVFDKVIHF